MTNYREMIEDAIMDAIVFKAASLIATELARWERPDRSVRLATHCIIHGHLPGWADVNERYRDGNIGPMPAEIRRAEIRRGSCKLHEDSIKKMIGKFRQ